MSVSQLIKVSPLPARRPTWREAFEWEGIKWFLDCGFGPDGHVREVFLTPRNTKLALAATMADACIGISFLLQRGMTVAEYLAKLTKLPPAEQLDGEEPLEENAAYSLIGDAMRRALRLENTHRNEALKLYGAAAR